MKNRPREIRRLLKLAALTAAKGLYREPKYKVGVWGEEVFVDQKYKDNTDDCKLIITINVR
jgi:hypothetical protein